MALTILQTPDNPNVSNTNLIYTVSSSNVPQYQFRYIADLYYSGSATKLARFKYPQNSSGTANIDLARPINDYLDTNYNWDITTIEAQSGNTYDTSSCKVFTIKFGEEYGTSYSSSVTTFPNEASSSIQVFQGNIQYPSIGDFNGSTNTRTIATSSINFNYTPFNFILSESTGSGSTVQQFADNLLTNDPNLLNSPATAKYWNDQNIDFTNNWLDDGEIRKRFHIGLNYYNSSSMGWYVAKPIGTSDYETLSQLTQEDSTTDVTLLLASAYDDNNDNIDNILIQLYNSDLKIKNSIVTVPVGPDVFSLGNLSSSWAWYGVEFLNVNNGYYGNPMPQFYYNEDKGPGALLSANISIPTVASSSFSPLPGGGIKPSLWKSGKYYPTNCKGEKTRFAFINSFGVWDYYNVYMPTRRVTSIDRKIYEQDRINLNDRIATFNVSNRGETQYYTEYTDEFEITTDILDSQESQWLREMFESTDVYIQSGSNFIPINILNNRETIINTTARNKNYQYTIRYQFSNLREPR
jgi:hypothetical protein